MGLLNSTVPAAPVAPAFQFGNTALTQSQLNDWATAHPAGSNGTNPAIASAAAASGATDAQVASAYNGAYGGTGQTSGTIDNYIAGHNSATGSLSGYSTDTTGKINYAAPPAPVVPAGVSPGQGTTASTYTPAKADPAQYTLNPATDTTGGQLSKIIDQNSPLMQQAATAGRQGANARGLLNSSIAVGAAQGAVLNAATPIAQQNAAASLQTGLTNTSNRQNTNLTNANATNTAHQFNAQAQNAIQKLKIGQSNQIALQNLVSGNAQLIQSNAELGNMYNQTVNSISSIQSSTTMAAPAKATAITNAIALLKQGVAASNAIATTAPGAVNSLNLSQYFTAKVA